MKKKNKYNIGCVKLSKKLETIEEDHEYDSIALNEEINFMDYSDISINDNKNDDNKNDDNKNDDNKNIFCNFIKYFCCFVFFC